jgi:hypothetical protein
LNVEVVEDVTAQKDVILRGEDDFEPTEASLGSLKRDEVRRYTCSGTIVGLCQNVADCHQFELVCDSVGDSRQISTCVQLGRNAPGPIGCPRMKDEDIKKGCRRLKALVI